MKPSPAPMSGRPKKEEVMGTLGLALDSLPSKHETIYQAWLANSWSVNSIPRKTCVAIESTLSKFMNWTSIIKYTKFRKARFGRFLPGCIWHSYYRFTSLQWMFPSFQKHCCSLTYYKNKIRMWFQILIDRWLFLKMAGPAAYATIAPYSTL